MTGRVVVPGPWPDSGRRWEQPDADPAGDLDAMLSTARGYRFAGYVHGATPAPAARDRLRQQTARAFDVPLWIVDDQRGRAEFALRAAELDRWADDGGPCPPDPAPAFLLPPIVVTVRPDAGTFAEAMGRAVRQLLDPFRQLAAAVIEAGRQLGRAFGIAGPWTDPAARRWAGTVPPTRWRDWLPATEPKVDRAHRERLERQLRTRDRRAARRRRIAAREQQRRRELAAGLRRVHDAGRRGADALTVLRAAAAGLTVQQPAALIFPGGIA